ncbi:hypothetical protein [Methylobacterium sp. GC_Met_1]|uniref:hypothetical protein n=1 Tax=Methylobacterium sp. GC_Met_1 TaxID=2937377 RepID=UPI00226A0274|nr:hypothetical protein [Methylobacterium sp. GC_Met_1]
MSVDALRAIVRSDLIEEIEARRAAQRTAAAKPGPASPKATIVSPPTLTRQAPASKPPTPPPVPKLSAMELIAKYTEGMDLREPVFPSLRAPTRAPSPKSVVDQDELAARAILDAARVARNR